MSEKEDFSVSVDWPLRGVAQGEEIMVPIYINNGEEAWWAVATANKEATPSGLETLVMVVQKTRYDTKEEAKWAVGEFIQRNEAALEKLINKSKCVAYNTR